MYIFISHSSKNEEAAEKICRILESHNHKCFLAARDIRPGREYAEEIVNGIDRADAVIVLLSKEANQSPHVLREVERSVSHSIPIIIYKLEDVELTKSMEYFLMTHQWMSKNKNDSFENILECVEDIAGDIDRAAGRKSSENMMEAEKITEGNVHKINNKKKSRLPVIGAAAVLIVAVAGIILFNVLGKNSDNETTGKNENNLSESVDKSITDSNVPDNDTTKDDDTDETGNSKEKNDDLELGDTVTLGTYLDEKINWRVLKISDDGSEAVLVSKDILTMKAFDGADGGEYNKYEGKDYWGQNTDADTDFELQAKVRGNNDWSLSNIRTWLNSEKEVVSYEGQAPTVKSMSDMKNGYDNEAGFLNGFSEEELSAIKTTKVLTNGNVLSEDETVTTEDRVFLLSKDELKWFEEADMTILAKPTEAARQQDATDWYEAYSLDIGMENFYWILREPAEESASKVYCVGDGYTEKNIFTKQAGTEGFGIRPAITVDINKLMELQ